jgi:hypothetical protein
MPRLQKDLGVPAVLNGTIMRYGGACAQGGQNIRLDEGHGVVHGHWLVRTEGR